jgi:hypothetical protein
MTGIAADRFDCRRRHGHSLLAIYMSSVNRRADSEQGRWSPATPYLPFGAVKTESKGKGNKRLRIRVADV